MRAFTRISMLSGLVAILGGLASAVPESGALLLTALAAVGWVTFWRRRWLAEGRGTANMGPALEVMR